MLRQILMNLWFSVKRVRTNVGLFRFLKRTPIKFPTNNIHGDTLVENVKALALDFFKTNHYAFLGN